MITGTDLTVFFSLKVNRVTLVGGSYSRKVATKRIVILTIKKVRRTKAETRVASESHVVDQD